MKRNRAIASMDIALVCLVGLFLALFVFLAFQMQHVVELSLVFCVEALIVLAVYFKGSLALGLTLSGLGVLGYGGYTLYRCLVEGAAPPARLYFFVLWIPLVTLFFWAFIRQSHALAVANGKMREDLDTLNTTDEETGMRNLRAYVNTMPAYMSLAKRYGLGLGLVTARVGDGGETGAVPTADLKQAVTALEDAMRVEDDVFLVSQVPYTFALVLLMQKNEDCAVVLERLRATEMPQTVWVDYGYLLYEHGDESVTAQHLLERALSKAAPEGAADSETEVDDA